MKSFSPFLAILFSFGLFGSVNPDCNVRTDQRTGSTSGTLFHILSRDFSNFVTVLVESVGLPYDFLWTDGSTEQTALAPFIQKFYS